MAGASSEAPAVHTNCLGYPVAPWPASRELTHTPPVRAPHSPTYQVSPGEIYVAGVSPEAPGDHAIRLVIPVAPLLSSREGSSSHLQALPQANVHRHPSIAWHFSNDERTYQHARCGFESPQPFLSWYALCFILFFPADLCHFARSWGIRHSMHRLVSHMFGFLS